MEKEKRNRAYKQNALRYTALTFLVTMLGALLVAGIWIKMEGESQAASWDVQREYRYHYMLITDSLEEELAKHLYEGARKAGEEHDILVEHLTDTAGNKKTAEELLKIAIAAGADGILVEGNDSSKVRELIDRASEENILVATILSDSKDSKRKCFVGIDTAQMGQIYGNRLMNLYQGRQLDVAVLCDAGAEGSLEDTICRIIEKSAPKEKFTVRRVAMEREDLFSADEEIRSLFLTRDKTPDILVCLSAQDSVCAYQVAVDLNLVGKVQILAYSSLQDVVSAVSKGIIDSSVLVDMEEVGAKAVNTLFEHRSSKHAEEYINVDVQVIEPENAEKYWNGE